MRAGPFAWLAAWVMVGALGGCDGPWATAPAARFQLAPVIVSFEVLVNAQTPWRGPYGILAHTSGQGPLTFVWDASGGVLSVGTASATADAALVPAFTAWEPPSWGGTHEVTLVVRDASGSATTRTARFRVDRLATRVLAPLPERSVREVWDPVRLGPVL